MALDAFLSVDSMLIYLELFSGWFFHQLLPNATLLILRCVFSSLSLSSFRNTRFSLHIHFVLCFIFWHTLPVASRLNVMLKVHMLRCIKRSFYQTNNIHTYVALHTHTLTRNEPYALKWCQMEHFSFFSWSSYGNSETLFQTIHIVAIAMATVASMTAITAFSQLILPVALYIYVMCEKWNLNVFH